MSLKKKIVIFFVIYTFIIIGIIAGISIYYLNEAFLLFSIAKNKAIFAIMSKRIFYKFIIIFLIIIAFVLLISIFIGIFLIKYITKVHINILKDLSAIAKERVKPEKNDKEYQLLRNYIDTLISDQEKLRDYEKVKAWKNGAKLLLHEINNPLTPMKLSIQTLLLDQKKPNTELTTINSSLIDVQEILSKFKNFINIEFGEKEEFDLLPLLKEVLSSFEKQEKKIAFKMNISSSKIKILSEKTLLKMVMNNLIKNGIEANKDDFLIKIDEFPEIITVQFITKNRKILKPEKIFRLAYSEKGKERGFGLFLCKQISDYLDLGINFKNKENDVIFYISINKISGV